MTHPIDWIWSGPLNMALRIVCLGPGHVANLSVGYQPTPATQSAVTELTAQEIGGALLGGVSADGPAVSRFRRVMAELDQAERAVQHLDDRLQALRDEQDEVDADGGPGIGKRLLALGREIQRLTTRRKEAAEEADILREVVARARTEAEQELAAAFAQHQNTAVECLAAKRSQVERGLLRQLGQALTSLIALDAALVRVRAGGALHSQEIERLLDHLPRETVGPMEPGDAADVAAQADADTAAVVEVADAGAVATQAEGQAVTAERPARRRRGKWQRIAEKNLKAAGLLTPAAA
jgi:hypothetical protein